jgi:predicted RNase H-like HicB family nuclease
MRLLVGENLYMIIPNAERAVVDVRKLRDYCLNSTHDQGKHKARLFESMNQKNKQIEKQPLEYYLNFQYPVILYPDQEGGYVAQIKDLPGCLTQGETLDETIANINEARELWIETAYEAGDEIPLPSTDDTYSGKLLLRMPKSLHRRLAEEADRENVSLNQYIVSVLSRG